MGVLISRLSSFRGLLAEESELELLPLSRAPFRESKYTLVSNFGDLKGVT